MSADQRLPPAPQDALFPPVAEVAAPIAAPVAAVPAPAASVLPWMILAFGAMTFGIFAAAVVGCGGILTFYSGGDPAIPPDPAAIALLEQLHSADAQQRITAAQQLESIGPGAWKAEPALRTALEDENQELRLAAAKALASITNKPQQVKREFSRRYVGRRNERTTAYGTEWEDVYEIQYETETIYPGGGN